MQDVLKVEYRDPHKHATKLRGFSSTWRNNTVSCYGVKNLTKKYGMPYWIMTYQENCAISRHIYVNHCILLL